MTKEIAGQQERIVFFEVFLIICAGFTVLTMLTSFFEGDLFKIFTPFFVPFILLFVFLGYLVLVVVSLLYIPFQIKNLTWRVFAPVIINITTFLIVYYFYDLMGGLRVDMGFQINESRYNQAANWVTQSIQSGDLVLEDTGRGVLLPREYRSLADDGKVYVIPAYGVISIFFSRGGGMFEYYPGYMYRSDDANPPIKDGDIVCIRRIMPNWYDCY